MNDCMNRNKVLLNIMKKLDKYLNAKYLHNIL